MQLKGYVQVCVSGWLAPTGKILGELSSSLCVFSGTKLSLGHFRGPQPAWAFPLPLENECSFSCDVDCVWSPARYQQMTSWRQNPELVSKIQILPSVSFDQVGFFQFYWVYFIWRRSMHVVYHIGSEIVLSVSFNMMLNPEAATWDSESCGSITLRKQRQSNNWIIHYTGMNVFTHMFCFSKEVRAI